MGREGLDKVKKEFPWSRVAKRMEGVYRKPANNDIILC
jgi:hypothetical protein